MKPNAARMREENRSARYPDRMNTHDLALSVLAAPLPDPVEAIAFPSARPAVALVLEGLARKAASGDAAAARELREWLRLEHEIAPPVPAEC